MNNPRVFVDFHHAGLLNSLILLFEGRLQGAVFRPIGIDWANMGYWAIYDHPATRQQYLTLDQGYRPEDGTPPLNTFVDGVPNPEKGTYYCQDIDSGKFNKAITLDEFMKREWDIVIASVPQHIEPFRRLCELHPSKPKLIYQIGNAWNIPEGLMVRNVMASAKVPNVPQGVNFVEYHQEFELDIFYPTNYTPPKRVSSFVNVFQEFPDWGLFLELEHQMPEWDYKSYGGQCRDGAAHGAQQVAQFMRDSQWIWHTKAGGDGYGHVLFSSAACGRPLITKKSYYEGKLGEKLMIDGETCINIDGLDIAEIVQKIVYYSEPERYRQMCQNVQDNFKKCVSFEEDAKKVEQFLDNLI
jgi:hypothetical protein